MAEFGIPRSAVPTLARPITRLITRVAATRVVDRFVVIDFSTSTRASNTVGTGAYLVLDAMAERSIEKWIAVLDSTLARIAAGGRTTSGMGKSHAGLFP